MASVLAIIRLFTVLSKSRKERCSRLFCNALQSSTKEVPSNGRAPLLITCIHIFVIEIIKPIKYNHGPSVRQRRSSVVVAVSCQVLINVPYPIARIWVPFLY